MILLIDNYDSFVYNLARYLEELGQDVRVMRNDAIQVSEIEPSFAPDAIVLSPGPCDPDRAGICVELVRTLSGRVPILGVCLGHQAIARAFGARVHASGFPRHGVASRVTHDRRGIFTGLPNPLEAARYHSLVVDPNTLPEILEVSATTREHGPGMEESETVMALRHRTHHTVGLQFHPESVLTPCGHDLLANFLRQVGITTGDRRDESVVAEVS